MKINAYTLYDAKALTYAPPFYQHADGSAVRMLSDLVNDLNTTPGRHPTDFSLWHCGVYDDSNGTFEASRPLRHVIDAAALIQQQPPLPLAPETPEPAPGPRPDRH